MVAAYGPGRKTYISGHEGLKIGLLALYRQTGDRRYRDLAKFFLDERGKDDYPRQGEYAIDRTYAGSRAGDAADRSGRPRGARHVSVHSAGRPRGARRQK